MKADTASSMKKSFKFGGRKKAKQATQNGSVDSPNPKAKRSLFHGSSGKRQKSAEDNRRGDTSLAVMDSEEVATSEEERPTRRQGSLLELQGKLGVLLVRQR